MSTEYPIVLVKNLPFNVSALVQFDTFGKYGNIHQIRVPDEKHSDDETYQPGTCLIVYSNVQSALRAAKELNGVNLQGRYLVASMYAVDKSKLSHEDFIQRKEELERLKKQYNIE